MEKRFCLRNCQKRTLVLLSLWGLLAVKLFYPKQRLNRIENLAGNSYEVKGPPDGVEAVLRNDTSEAFVTTEAGFHPNETHLLLILSYQRCGSSFFGDVFGKHPDVMYVYEPLDGLYTHMYGTAEGWNVPSDITNYNNGTARIPPRLEVEAVTNLLDSLFNCSIDTIPTAVLYSKFWKQFESQHKSLSAFVKCSSRKSRRSIDNCRSVSIPRHCPRRFNASNPKLEACRSALEEAHSGKTNKSLHDGNFAAYVRCLNEIRSTLGHCGNVLQDICHKKAFVAVKTVRATMDSVEDLINRHPNLRVIHLIRDPRAVVLSRRKFNPSGYGIYSMLDTDDKMDLVKEAKLYCNTVIRDIAKRRELEAKYPGMIQEVIYEHFTEDPLRAAEELYRFIGIPFNKTVSMWLKRNISDRNGDGQKSTYIARKWWQSLLYSKAREIMETCWQLFQEVSYKWPC